MKEEPIVLLNTSAGLDRPADAMITLAGRRGPGEGAVGSVPTIGGGDTVMGAHEIPEAVSTIQPTDGEPGVRALPLSAPPVHGDRLATGLPVTARAPESALPDTDRTAIALLSLRGQPLAPAVIYRPRWRGLTQLNQRAQDRAGTDEHVDPDRHPDAQRKLPAPSGDRRRTRVVHVNGDWLMRAGPRRVQTGLVRHGAVR